MYQPYIVRHVNSVSYPYKGNPHKFRGGDVRKNKYRCRLSVREHRLLEWELVSQCKEVTGAAEGVVDWGSRLRARAKNFCLLIIIKWSLTHFGASGSFVTHVFQRGKNTADCSSTSSSSVLILEASLLNHYIASYPGPLHKLRLACRFIT